MFKFKHIVLLAVLCLFSLALLGADKVAEQMVSDYEKQIDNAKSTVITTRLFFSESPDFIFPDSRDSTLLLLSCSAAREKFRETVL